MLLATQNSGDVSSRAAELTSVRAIERELAGLRAEASAEDAPNLRTSVMTHVAWVPEPWIDAATETLAGLGERHPSRTILLFPHPRAERDGLEAELDEVTPGDEAGIKSATFILRGKNAYGLLSAERGVHRLVRISPYDASKRRHTSFASLDVIPLIEEEVEEIEIDPKDLRIDTYRSSGAGGQHVNVTDSAVRITHLPTGITAACQNERSQMQNRAVALRILKARLANRVRRERDAKIESLRGERRDIEFGSQIRSYVLHPYRLVKDHRTGVEVGNVDRVLDGDLDDLIEAALRHRRRSES